MERMSKEAMRTEVEAQKKFDKQDCIHPEPYRWRDGEWHCRKCDAVMV